MRVDLHHILHDQCKENKLTFMSVHEHQLLWTNHHTIIYHNHCKFLIHRLQNHTPCRWVQRFWNQFGQGPTILSIGPLNINLNLKNPSIYCRGFSISTSNVPECNFHMKYKWVLLNVSMTPWQTSR